MAHFMTCRSSTSIYVDYFAAKEHRYYSSGYLTTLFNRTYLISWTESYSIRGLQESQQNQEIEYHVHTLRLRAEQKQAFQLNPSFIPTPVLNDRFAQSFCVSSDATIK